MKRLLSLMMVFVVMSCFARPALAQKARRLLIATGGTGGVYYPMGGGMATVLSTYLPDLEGMAEVTTGSVDNCLRVASGKADLALVMADTAWDALRGKGRFDAPLPLRTVAVLYPNSFHIVTLEGNRIEKVTDLKGKRVSTGSPGSGTEVMALRVFKAYGLHPDKDMKRDQLSASESAGALKEGKIDAYVWCGGLPTASIADLGAAPKLKLKLIGHADAVPKMREQYGPLYVKEVIPAKTYPGQDVDVPIATVWNLLICDEKMRQDIVYDVIRTLFDHKPELVSIHREGRWLGLDPQVSGASPLSFHPGAIRYFSEKGLKVR